jgi:glycerophosphoryl diester phosphodiesterase
MLRPFLSSDRPIGFAHRGGSALWPENTLEAFRGALGLGISHLETDVHCTRDGELVVFHDARLDRTTDGHGYLRNFTLAELRRLDAGYRMTPDGLSFPFRGKGLRIPTFAELCELDPEVRINVELKAEGADLPREMWRFIEERGLHDRILVAAAKHSLVREFRAVSRGRVATSASAREVVRFWAAARVGITRRLRTDYAALQVPVAQGPLTVVTPRFVTAAHDRGLHVHVWTIDDPAEMRRLAALGVDGLMSDRPDLLAATCARLRHASQA